MAALRKIVKTPRVQILRGNVRKSRTGRTNALSNPKTRPVSSHDCQSVNQMPEIQRSVNFSAMTLLIHRIKNNFMSEGYLEKFPLTWRLGLRVRLQLVSSTVHRLVQDRIGTGDHRMRPGDLSKLHLCKPLGQGLYLFS